MIALTHVFANRFPYYMLLHFPPLHFGPSRIFQSRIFSVPSSLTIAVFGRYLKTSLFARY